MALGEILRQKEEDTVGGLLPYAAPSPDFREFEVSGGL